MNLKKNKSEIMKQISENTKKFRKKNNMTQEKLAEESELSISFISLLERNNLENISIIKLEQISKALNISIIQILETKKESSEKKPDNLLILENYLLTLDEEKTNQISLSILELIKSIK